MSFTTAPPARAPRRRSCPHCRGRRIHRWGFASGRQRYRCLACGRTFSAYTGTVLYYLKRADAWDAFLVAMRDCLSVRQAALAADIHRDTAFRWRHRLLESVESRERVLLTDQVAVGSTWFRYSRKGAAAPRGRMEGARPDGAWPEGAPGPAGARRVWVVLARDGGGRAVGTVVGGRQPLAEVLTECMRGRVAGDATIRARTGPYSPAALCARRLGLTYSRLGPTTPGAELESVPSYAARLKRWMRRFHGVATRYLSHYLAWFRSIDAG